MDHKLLSSAGVVLVASMVSTASMAYGPEAKDVQAKSFVAAGAAYVPDYEGSDDYRAWPAVAGRYTWDSGRYANLAGAGGVEQAARLSINLIDARVTQTWTMGPILQYRLERNSSDLDDSRVKKMRDVDAETEAGAFISWEKDRFGVDVAFAADISDKSNGALGYLSGDYKLPFSTEKTLFKLGAHLTYADSNFMQEYFGVSKKDAQRSGLSRHHASGGLKDTGLRATMLHMFNPRWGMFGSVGYTRMLNDAEDSPLVDDRGDKHQYSGAVTAVYMF